MYLKTDADRLGERVECEQIQSQKLYVASMKYSQVLTRKTIDGVRLLTKTDGIKQ